MLFFLLIFTTSLLFSSGEKDLKLLTVPRAMFTSSQVDHLVKYSYIEQLRVPKDEAECFKQESIVASDEKSSKILLHRGLCNTFYSRCVSTVIVNSFEPTKDKTALDLCREKRNGNRGYLTVSRPVAVQVAESISYWFSASDEARDFWNYYVAKVKMSSTSALDVDYMLKYDFSQYRKKWNDVGSVKK